MKTRKQHIGIVLLLVALASRTLADERSEYAEKIIGREIFLNSIVYVGEVTPPIHESEDLSHQLDAFNLGVKPGLEAVETFVGAHPDSAWTPSLRANLAEYYRGHGRYSRALKHWEGSWEKVKSAKSAMERSMAERVLSQWTRLLGSLGRLERLKELFAEAHTLGLDQGEMAPIMEGAKGGMRKMIEEPGISYRCGTYALFHVGRKLNPEDTGLRNLLRLSSPESGFDMARLLDIAHTNHLELEAVRRLPGGELVVPSVVHWRENHYAAIIEQKGDSYLVIDPTFGRPLWMDKEVIEEEADGRFLVAQNTAPANWERLPATELAMVYGKGYPNDIDNEEDTPPDGCDENCDSESGMAGDTADSEPSMANDDGEASPCNGPPCPTNDASGMTFVSPGMPQWRVSEPYITLWMVDTPLEYRKSNGKFERFRLYYNHRNTSQSTNVAGFGPRWCSRDITYIQKDSSQSTVTHYVGGGGLRRGLDPSGSGHEFRQGLTVAQNGPTWLMRFRTGSSNTFDNPRAFGVGITNYYMTSRSDRLGRRTQFNWTVATISSKNYYRVTNTIDFDGKGFTLEYTNASFPAVITKVTDPYGRYASFKYDSSGQLTNIVDAQGLSTTFQYDGSGFITSMTTPYGTTTFSYNSVVYDPTKVYYLGGTNYNRALTITEPNGAKQQYVYMDGPYGPDSHRNSYHWDRKQYQAISSTAKTNLLLLSWDDYRAAGYKIWLRNTTDYYTNSAGEQVVGIMQSSSRSVASSGDTDRVGLHGLRYPDQAGDDPSVTGSSGMTSRNEITVGGVSAPMDISRTGYGRATKKVVSFTDYHGSGRNITNRWDYDQDGRRLTKFYGPNDELLKGYKYDSTYPYLITTITNALSQNTSYTYDTNYMKIRTITYPSGLVVSNVFYTSGTYAGWLQARIEIGFRTNSYSYVNGLPLVHTNELGLVTTNSWDNLNRLTGITFPDQTTISNVYDKLDLSSFKDRLTNWTYYAHDSVRQLTGITNANNTNTFVYCDCGSLSEIIDALGQHTYFYYDLAGRMINAVYPDGSSYTNAFFDDGLVSQVTDNTGRSLSLTYDPLTSKLQTVKAANGNGGVFYQAFYDYYGRLTNSVDWRGRQTDYTYDSLNRLKTRLMAGAGAETNIYSATGLTNYIDGLGRTNIFIVDTLGRTTAQTNANSEVTRFTYDGAGDMLTLVDGNNHTTTWHYDLYGRVTNKLDQASAEIFRYAYDANSQLTNRWSAAKGNTTYKYDVVGNLTNVVYPTSSSLTYKYDALNRLTNMVDAVGTTSFGYTGVGQLASEDGPWDQDTITYSYSSRHRSTMSLLQPNSPAWLQSYAYVSESWLPQSIASPAGTFSYDYQYYNAPVDLQTLTLPSGALVTYTHDATSRNLTSSQLSSGVYGTIEQFDYLYDALFQRTNQVHQTLAADGSAAYTTTDYAYDKTGQLTSATGWDYDGAGTRTAQRSHETFGYGYDAGNNLHYRTNNALIQTFTVDSKNQLSSVSRSGTLTVAGSATPAATSVTVNGSSATLYTDKAFAKTGMTVTNGNNAFAAIAQDGYGRKDTNSVSVNLPSSPGYQYDSNGNLTSDGTRGFDYDDENQLTRITVTNSWKSEFTYDGKLRRRIGKEFIWQNSAWVTTNEVRYIYDGMVVIQERDANNLPRVSYTRGLDLSWTGQGAGGIGGLLARTDNDKLSVGDESAHAYYCDAGGNITTLLDAHDRVVARYVYDPYGNLIGKYGSMADANTYRFSSKEIHPNSGFYYYGYRFYDPNTQRWINRDRLGESGGVNLYTAVHNSPTQWVDLFGLDPYDKFPTLEDALKDLMEWLKKHPAIDKDGEPNEQSATVFKDKDGKCYYPFPKEDPSLPGKSPRDLKNGKLDKEDQPAGHGHSHIKGEDFSPQDKELADRDGIPEWVLTPSGKTIKYVPKKNK